MHSDNTILANGRAIAKDWEFDQNTIVYSFSPMSHNIGIVGLGRCRCLRRRIRRAYAARCVAHARPHRRDGRDLLFGVPTHAIDLLTEMRRRGMATLGQVKAFQLGGAPVPPTTVRGLMDVGVKIQNAFGMTENHSFQYTRPD